MSQTNSSENFLPNIDHYGGHGFGGTITVKAEEILANLPSDEYLKKIRLFRDMRSFQESRM